MRRPDSDRLRARTLFGKYRVRRRLNSGGFGTVYEATDTLEGIRVALKVPHAHLVDESTLRWIKSEARTQAGLDHPGILPLKNAEFIDGHLVLVHPLGLGTLAERMQRRMSLDTVLLLARQMISAVAHAHERRVIHCDLKPENFILFPDNRLRLTDFGIAKVSLRTVEGSGSGTLGYIAPEQALGRPSFRSDVFSLGLILYQMLTRELPAWPFHWPAPGYETLRRRVSTGVVELLRRALDPDPELRFASAAALSRAFEEALPRAARRGAESRSRPARAQSRSEEKKRRFQQFLRRHRGALGLRHECSLCGGPISEPMQVCPWCGSEPSFERRPVDFPARCPRCHRGRKLDWRSCAWCHGPGFEEVSSRSYTDRRYEGHCAAPSCRGSLIPFSRYCPWCRRKAGRCWTFRGAAAKCPRCKCGVAGEWSHCPWCARNLGQGEEARGR